MPPSKYTQNLTTSLLLSGCHSGPRVHLFSLCFLRATLSTSIPPPYLPQPFWSLLSRGILPLQRNPTKSHAKSWHSSLQSPFMTSWKQNLSKDPCYYNNLTSYSLGLVPSILALLTSLFLRYVPYTPASGLLHVLFLLSGVPFSRYLHDFFLYILEVFALSGSPCLPVLYKLYLKLQNVPIVHFLLLLYYPVI